MSNEEIDSRLAFCRFEPAQRQALAAAQARITQLLPDALDRFYDSARKTPATARQFRDDAHMAGAKRAQLAHWQRIATGNFDEGYHASVRRIGARHAQIGLEPRWYIGAYMMVLESLIEGLLTRKSRIGGASRKEIATIVAVTKAALLDMELSVSIYFELSVAAQSQASGALESALARLAEGDLTASIEETFDPSYEPLRTNYNSAIDQLRDLAGTVISSAAAIRADSGEIAQASENLARRTETNAASLEETSAAVSQMDQRLRATADAAARTVRCADEAIAAVSNGRGIADEAVQAMGRVSESAKGIDSVIEGLDKIAFQTRVLAMNAAVEAGRAGEAGRGFAVVADLVSALAMRAEEEAGRARDQLTTTQSDIVAAVEMVQKVDGALSDISSDVDEVHKLLADMATDNRAQATAVTEISTAIGSMDQATQQNAAMVEETSAAARNLSHEVAQLAEQAGRFHIGEGASQFVPSRPRTKGGAKARAATSPAAARPVATAVARADAVHEEWTSF